MGERTGVNVQKSSLAGVYKIKEINGGNCRQSNDLATSGLYVLTELAQRGIGA
jgi:hypothetical protein